jgi:hypothetical protein
MRDRAPTRLACSRSAAIAAVATALGAGALGAGCGSSKHTASTATAATPPTISKVQLLAEGNAICREGNRKQAALRRSLEKTFAHREPSPAQLAGYVSSVFAPLIQHQIDAIRALGAPRGEGPRVRSMLDLAQADLNKVKAKPAELLTGRPPFADFARQAHAYGLRACARNQ